MEENPTRAKKLKFWQEFWPLLQDASKETENHIDKKVYGITVGGIGVEMASLQYLDSVKFKVIAIIAGGLFIAALLLNLYSHVRALDSIEEEEDSIQAFFDQEDAVDDSGIYALIQKKNRGITIINHISIWTMALGIASLMAFIVVNI